MLLNKFESTAPHARMEAWKKSANKDHGARCLRIFPFNFIVPFGSASENEENNYFSDCVWNREANKKKNTPTQPFRAGHYEVLKHLKIYRSKNMHWLASTFLPDDNTSTWTLLCLWILFAISSAKLCRCCDGIADSVDDKSGNIGTTMKWNIIITTV